MLLVEITNSKEMVATKNKFIAKIATENIDKNIVEAQVIKQMSKDLATWGLEGVITIVQGIEVEGNGVLITKGLSIKQEKKFGKGNQDEKQDYSKPR